MNPHSNTWQPVPPEQLMQLGKTAAHMAETSGASLTDAVVRTIGMTKLNEQQVRRVVEAANHEAYNRKFASMDAEMRVVDIDGGPADPTAVVDRLRAASEPIPAHSYSDYRTPPQTKVASLRYTEPVTKTAALHDILVLREKLSAAHEELVGHVGATRAHVTTAVQKLASAVREAVEQGAYREDFEGAWRRLSPKHAAALFHALSLPSAPPGVKVAHRRVSDGHPTLTLFSEYAKRAHEYEGACEAVRSIEEELVRVNSFIKEHGA